MIRVIGAGMAGLLAGALLRDRCCSIREAQASLPNNHSAVLRFRSSVVGDALNIPFKKVKVMKGIHPWQSPVADALAYSRKTNGTATLRSVVTANGDIDERYIAPEDFIYRMSKCVMAPVVFSNPAGPETVDGKLPTISTIPMPALMKLLDWKGVPEFNSVLGYNVNCLLEEGTDAYVSVYVPDPFRAESRISITGRLLTIECQMPTLDRDQAKQVVERIDTTNLIQQSLYTIGCSGISYTDEVVRLQQYSKILPISETIRQRFILWASEHHNVYSLGRFATWRPGLLLDDLVNDVRTIQRIIENGSYNHRKG